MKKLELKIASQSEVKEIRPFMMTNPLINQSNINYLNLGKISVKLHGNNDDENENNNNNLKTIESEENIMNKVILLDKNNKKINIKKLQKTQSLADKKLIKNESQEKITEQKITEEKSNEINISKH